MARCALSTQTIHRLVHTFENTQDRKLQLRQQNPDPAPEVRVGLRAVARLAGISRPAMQRRFERGELPSPAGWRTRGTPYWHVRDIQRWLDELPLPQCPVCGAKFKRLAWHLEQRHPGAETLVDIDDPRRDSGGLEWLTTAQVADELQVGIVTARELITTGELPGRREVGGSYQVERAMFERWLKRQYQLTREFIAAQPFPARNRPRT